MVRSGYTIELAAVREVYGSDDTVTEVATEWFQMDDFARKCVVPEEVWDAVLDVVDEKSKVEDAERRRLPEGKACKPPYMSRWTRKPRRHGLSVKARYAGSFDP
jgi:hypothetical protein